MTIRDGAVDFNIVLRDGEELICPLCSSENLHQCRVRSVFRKDEDEDGLEVVHERSGVQTHHVRDEEIAGRRDVLYIDFTCENCWLDFRDLHLVGEVEVDPIDGNNPAVCTLMIKQHKGLTLVSWQLSDWVIENIQPRWKNT